MAGLDRLAGPPIFVVGHHRSGTTWVFDLLTYPEDVAGIFESWLFTKEYGLVGLLHAGHWEPEQIARVETIFGRRAGLGQLASHDDVVAMVRGLATDLFERARGSQTRHIVEKSPDHLYAALEISEVFPDARFINVIRDGRDVAVSLDAARAWSPARSTSEIGRRWGGALAYSRTIAQQLGPRYTEVSYEALHADTRGELQKLFAFCGFEPDDAVIDAAIEASDFDTNFEGGEDRFRRAGRVGDWKTRMSLRDRFAFHRGGGGELIARGYERSRWWWLRRP